MTIHHNNTTASSVPRQCLTGASLVPAGLTGTAPVPRPSNIRHPHTPHPTPRTPHATTRDCYTRPRTATPSSHTTATTATTASAITAHHPADHTAPHTKAQYTHTHHHARPDATTHDRSTATHPTRRHHVSPLHATTHHTAHISTHNASQTAHYGHCTLHSTITHHTSLRTSHTTATHYHTHHHTAHASLSTTTHTAHDHHTQITYVRRPPPAMAWHRTTQPATHAKTLTHANRSPFNPASQTHSELGTADTASTKTLTPTTTVRIMLARPDRTGPNHGDAPTIPFRPTQTGTTRARHDTQRNQSARLMPSGPAQHDRYHPETLNANNRHDSAGDKPPISTRSVRITQPVYLGMSKPETSSSAARTHNAEATNSVRPLPRHASQSIPCGHTELDTSN